MQLAIIADDLFMIKILWVYVPGHDLLKIPCTCVSNTSVVRCNITTAQCDVILITCTGMYRFGLIVHIESCFVSLAMNYALFLYTTSSYSALLYYCYTDMEMIQQVQLLKAFLVPIENYSPFLNVL